MEAFWVFTEGWKMVEQVGNVLTHVYTKVGLWLGKANPNVWWSFTGGALNLQEARIRCSLFLSSRDTENTVGFIAGILYPRRFSRVPPIKTRFSSFHMDSFSIQLTELEIRPLGWLSFAQVRQHREFLRGAPQLPLR